MTSTHCARPIDERCERPTKAPESADGVQPGRLAQGPDEKHGLTGRRVGFIAHPLDYGLTDQKSEAAARAARNLCRGAAPVNQTPGAAPAASPRGFPSGGSLRRRCPKEN